jgi:hypothetical protein
MISEQEQICMLKSQMLEEIYEQLKITASNGHTETKVARGETKYSDNVTKSLNEQIAKNQAL